MKTISVKFLDKGVLVATATGTFKTVPGTGPVKWSGTWVTTPPSILTKGLPNLGISEIFKERMCRLADRLGLEADVSETGEWQVFNR